VICRDLSNLSRFSSLEMLILDKNSITSLHAIKCPCIPTLSDLSCNNNNIADAMEFLLEVSEKFPNLHHLSIMRNPGVIDPFDEGIVGKLFSTKSTVENNGDIISNIPDQTAGNLASELIPAEAPATTNAAEDTAVVDCVDFVCFIMSTDAVNMFDINHSRNVSYSVQNIIISSNKYFVTFLQQLFL
jgi:Leucine-rich repeat (LRR) protein